MAHSSTGMGVGFFVSRRSQDGAAVETTEGLQALGLPSSQSDDSRKMPTEELVHILVHT
jgi:hypothetical protein